MSFLSNAVKINIFAVTCLMLSSCSKNLDKKKLNTLNFYRNSQRVQRFDCDNKLFSDKVEVVQKRTSVYRTIKAQSGIESAVDSSYFKVLNTDDDDGIIFNRNTIQLRMYDDNFVYKLQEGRNDILYVYKEFDIELNDYVELERGTVQVYMQYKEHLNPGISKIFKSQEDCQQPE